MEPRSKNRIFMSITSAQTCTLTYPAKLLNLFFNTCLKHWKKLQPPPQVGNTKQSTQLEIATLELSAVPTTVTGKADSNHCYWAIVASPSSTHKLFKVGKKTVRSSWILSFLVRAVFWLPTHTLPAFWMINSLLL